jgi:hypothetical protein
MDTFTLIVMIAAVLGVVVLILLFERRRAKEIERDLRRNEQPSAPAQEREWEWERKE